MSLAIATSWNKVINVFKINIWGDISADIQLEILVLIGHVFGAIIRDFWKYIRRFSSANEHFEYGPPHSNICKCLFTLNILCLVSNQSISISFKPHDIHQNET